MKKRKFDSSQPVKRGKGKQVESSLESEEVSESDDDDEIELMFAEGSESEQEKLAQSIANRGFHCERGGEVGDIFVLSSYQGSYSRSEYAVRVH